MGISIKTMMRMYVSFQWSLEVLSQNKGQNLAHFLGKNMHAFLFLLQDMISTGCA